MIQGLIKQFRSEGKVAQNTIALPTAHVGIYYRAKAHHPCPKRLTLNWSIYPSEAMAMAKAAKADNMTVYFGDLPPLFAPDRG